MASFRPLWRKVRESTKTGTASDNVYKPTWFAFEKMESFLHGVSVARNTYNSENWEQSTDHEEIEEVSLRESASTSGVCMAYTDIQKQSETRGADNNENEVTTENVSKVEKGGSKIGTDSNYIHFKTPVGGASKNKRKAQEMEETERRMDEAYEILKQCHNTKTPKLTLCTAYGQLLATRLETLSEVNRLIVMNEIDNIFFRITMGSMGPQYQSASPGPMSSASFYSSSSHETFNTTASVTSLPNVTSLPRVAASLTQNATSLVQQPSLAPIIPTSTCDILPTENYTIL